MHIAAGRILLAAATLSLAGAAALAQGRPDTTRMSCRQAAGLVQAQGAIVLGTGGHSYDRYVRDRGFCQVTQSTKAAFAPAADNPQCFVGYTCFDPSGRFTDDFR